MTSAYQAMDARSTLPLMAALYPRASDTEA
jgi:hypothetical protein